MLARVNLRVICFTVALSREYNAGITYAVDNCQQELKKNNCSAQTYCKRLPDIQPYELNNGEYNEFEEQKEVLLPLVFLRVIL